MPWLLRSLLLVPVLVAGGCVTETTTHGPLVWVDHVSYGNGMEVAGPQIPPGADEAEEPAETPPPPRRPPDPDRVVRISEKTLGELMAIINRPQCMIADRIEVEASQIPFKPAFVPVADPAYVESVQTKGPEGKPNGLLMRSRMEDQMVERDCPRLRVGDGIDLIASREIRVRYHSKVEKSRPVFLRIVALGRAVHRDVETGKRIEGDAITLFADLVEGPDGLVLRHRIR